jgi:hypothetical protein
VSRERRRYISYLLRLWQIESGGELIWRASLESALTGKQRGFASLDDLFEFLREQTIQELSGDEQKDVRRMR